MSSIHISPGSRLNNMQRILAVDADKLYFINHQVSALNDSVYGYQPTYDELTGNHISVGDYGLCADVIKLGQRVHELVHFAEKPFAYLSGWDLLSIQNDPFTVYILPLTSISVSLADLNESNAFVDGQIKDRRDGEASISIVNDCAELIYVLSDYSVSATSAFFEEGGRLSGGYWECIGTTSFKNSDIVNLISSECASALNSAKAYIDDRLSTKADKSEVLPVSPSQIYPGGWTIKPEMIDLCADTVEFTNPDAVLYLREGNVINEHEVVDQIRFELRNYLNLSGGQLIGPLSAPSIDVENIKVGTTLTVDRIQNNDDTEGLEVPNGGQGGGTIATENYVDSALSAKISSLAKVAITGLYNDLSDLPTIPEANDGVLTIQRNGIVITSFSANQSANISANISVPTKTSELSNDSDFVVSSVLNDYVLISTNEALSTQVNGIESSLEQYVRKSDLSTAIVSALSNDTLEDVDHVYYNWTTAGDLENGYTPHTISAAIMWNRRLHQALINVLNAIDCSPHNPELPFELTLDPKNTYIVVDESDQNGLNSIAMNIEPINNQTAIMTVYDVVEE